MKFFIIIILPLILFRSSSNSAQQQSRYTGQSAIKSADWVKDAIIYCVYLRSFSKEGTFAALEKRVPELKDLGVLNLSAKTERAILDVGQENIFAPRQRIVMKELFSDSTITFVSTKPSELDLQPHGYMIFVSE